MMYAESDFIQLSALQHYLFCPRQCALIHVEQIWVESGLNLPMELAKQGNRFIVDLIEGRHEAEVNASVLFDPKGERLRA